VSKALKSALAQLNNPAINTALKTAAPPLHGEVPLPKEFAKKLVAWQKKHGRHDLPWQLELKAYPVWLSEVMLQQTQVSTVKVYFQKFMLRFPRVEDLACADINEVLALWTGLGYYTRARNLHRCAIEVTQTHGGVFPQELEALKSLPGIGESTAAAIASLCFQKRVAITDGNVRRVLARVMGFEGDMGLGSSVKWLSQVAQSLLPNQPSSMPTYTQGIMDLGATVCKPKNPLCDRCPMSEVCVAREQGLIDKIPVKSKKIKRTFEQLFWLIAQNPKGEVLGIKRGDKGIWAGLYGFAEFDSEEALINATTTRVGKSRIAKAQKNTGRVAPRALEVVRHELTHKSLSIHPFFWTAPMDFERPGAEWLTESQWRQVGLSRPVEDLLRSVFAGS
jgi:A/G-specific adenine glycosylase